MSKLNWDKFSPVLGKWGKYLKPLFESKEMNSIYEELKTLGRRNKQITPSSDDTWKFLSSVDPKNLKVIIIGMDSFPGAYKNGTFHSTGIAFDCSNSPDGKLQPSLEKLLEGIGNDIGEKLELTNDISYLCEQGVMLGNRAITCELLKTGSHMGKWDFFWQYFLQDVISNYFPGVPIILLGDDSKKLKKYIFEMSNPTFILTHPSNAARNEIDWDTKNVFKIVNKMLKENNGEDYQIIWDKKQYLQPTELPF